MNEERPLVVMGKFAGKEAAADVDAALLWGGQGLTAAGACTCSSRYTYFQPYQATSVHPHPRLVRVCQEREQPRYGALASNATLLADGKLKQVAEAAVT
jgi:hypothetical protein